MQGLTDNEANEVQQDLNKNANQAEEDAYVARKRDDVALSHVPARY